MSEKDLSPVDLIRLAESWVGEGNDGMVKYYLEKAVERIEAAQHSAHLTGGTVAPVEDNLETELVAPADTVLAASK